MPVLCLLGTFCFAFTMPVLCLLLCLTPFFNMFLTEKHIKSPLPINVGKWAKTTPKTAVISGTIV